MLDLKRRAGTAFQGVRAVQTQSAAQSMVMVKRLVALPKRMLLQQAANGRADVPLLGVTFCTVARRCSAWLAGCSEFSRGDLAVHWQPWSSQRRPS